MAAYVRLFRKSAPDQGPVDYNLLDEEICQHFGLKCDSEKFAYGWYDSIIWRLGLDLNWEDIRSRLRANRPNDGSEYAKVFDVLLDIVSWLEEHFTVNTSWGR